MLLVPCSSMSTLTRDIETQVRGRCYFNKTLQLIRKIIVFAWFVSLVSSLFWGLRGVDVSDVSYLYDDCTVKKAYDGVVIKTFRDSLRVTIANNNENDDVAIEIKGQDTKEPPNVPKKKKWTEIECRVSSNGKPECGEEMSNTAEKKNSDLLLKEFTIKNAEVLANCPQGLPNKELTLATWIDFPRWNSTREHFAVIPEVNLTVSLSIFGEELFLCWDGKQTAVNTSKGDCQALPAHEVHKITLDYESHKIKSDDGRILRRLNPTNANKDALMKMKTDGGKAWAVQSLGDWRDLQDQDQSTYNRMECTSNTDRNILLAFLILFLVTTIALCCYLLRIKRNSSKSRSYPASQVLELNTATESMTNENHGRIDYGEETVNDIYGYDG
ncbi:uncharacterized protein LOC119590453 [Penaeus monodon]|uniref:uncharacterized protein LOC119590453 n=1 Tax=Penaeus monodon TaxID=6687 RepID=UPI0018A72631|nr:uncharacterized protein LOC119590453 [Penaeus monodon]